MDDILKTFDDLDDLLIKAIEAEGGAVRVGFITADLAKLAPIYADAEARPVAEAVLAQWAAGPDELRKNIAAVWALRAGMSAARAIGGGARVAASGARTVARGATRATARKAGNAMLSKPAQVAAMGVTLGPAAVDGLSAAAKSVKNAVKTKAAGMVVNRMGGVAAAGGAAAAAGLGSEAMRKPSPVATLPRPTLPRPPRPL